MGLPGLRADALVGQGPGTPADPVCGGRRGGLGLAAPSGRRPWSRPAARLAGEEQEKLVEIEARFRLREQDIDRFVAAYRQYCWPVESLADLKLAPFHLLATEGHVHTDKDHLWHMETSGRGLPGRSRTAAGDPVQGRGRDRPGEPGRGDRLVGGADRAGAARGWSSSR